MLIKLLQAIPFFVTIALAFLFLRVVKKAAEKDSRILTLNSVISNLNEENRVLRESAGPEAILWTKQNSKDIDVIARIPPSKTVIITGAELHHVYSVRYNCGFADSRTEHNPYPLCNHKSYDGVYREHVNKLAGIAKEFYGAGQLRSRIQDTVLRFRHELAAMQMGTMEIPGKKNPPSRGSILADGAVVWLRPGEQPFPEKPQV